MTPTYEDVCAQVRAAALGHRDLRVGRRDLALQEGRLTCPDAPDGWTLTPWATAQLCQRLAIPTAYFRRCPPALQDAQVNHWLAADRRRRQRWLLRTNEHRLRGLLTERYALLDHPDLLASLAPLVAGRFEVTWFALTDESLHLRLLDPQLTREVLPRDRLVAGLHIANSEVGLRAVTVDALVFRLVCANGLIRLVKGQSLLHQRHVALSRLRFAARLKEAVREALLQSMGFLERLSLATREPVPKMDKALKALAARWSLPLSTQQKVRQALLSEPNGQQETLYGLVNAVTNAAQTLPAEDRYRLETLAGALLEHGTGARGLPGRPPPGTWTASDEDGLDPALEPPQQRKVA